MLDLLWRTCFHWQLWPHLVCGDTTYGTVENIVPIEDAGIRAYLPLPDFTRRTAYYGQDKFTYDDAHDCYWCPQGQPLSRRKLVRSEQTIVYRAAAETCNHCPVKAKCTDSSAGRTLRRSWYANYLDRVAAYHETAAYEKAINKRKVWVEPLFGEAKQWHGMRRFRLRRLERVNIEALLIAAGQNVKRLVAGRRSWPAPATEQRIQAISTRNWSHLRPLSV